MAGVLETTYIGDLVANKRFLIFAPKDATVEKVLKIMAENEITAIPVAASPGQQASVEGTTFFQGSSHYIGIVSMLDVVLHIGDNLDDCENALQTPVSDLIGQTIESRALWTAGSRVKLIDGMECMSKGVHRFLVPIHGHNNERSPHETTQFRFLTQTDVVSFLLEHIDEMGPCVSRTITDLGLLHPNMAALSVPSNMILSSALRLMHRKPAFSSFGVVEASPEEEMDSSQSQQFGVSGGKLMGSLSANCFRGMGVEEISWSLRPEITVAEFLKMSAEKGFSRPLVTIHPTTPLGTAMAVAITNKVHRVWVTDEDGWLLGVVSLTDIISVARRGPTSFVHQ